MRIDFHPRAVEELDESFQWYAERSTEAAARFARAVEGALQKIADAPLRFPVVDSTCRACSVEHFPFQIVFQVDSGRILILAVAHAKRRPGYWRRRG